MGGAPVIFVRQGDLGNQIIQIHVCAPAEPEGGGVKIIGNNMPEWGLVSSELTPPVGRCVRTGRLHKIDLDALADILKSGAVDWVDLDCYAQRREYFEEDRDSFARMFLSPVTGEVLSKDEIAIHVRTGDIVAGGHRDYMPLPLAYYRRLIDETGYKPVFVGQVSGNFYTDALRRQFADARFICRDRPAPRFSNHTQCAQYRYCSRHFLMARRIFVGDCPDYSLSGSRDARSGSATGH